MKHIHAFVVSHGEVQIDAQTGSRIGEFVSVDSDIDFTTKSRSYLNGEDGTAFPEGSYTWKTYLKAPETGEYNLKLECIGGNARFLISINGVWKQAGISKEREGTQWPWDTVVCTETGMGIDSEAFDLEEGKVYPIVVYAEHAVIHKDLQIRLAWAKPSYRKYNYEAAINAAKNADTVIFYAVNCNENEKMHHSFIKSNDPSINLASEQMNLLKDVAASRKDGAKLVVVMQTSVALACSGWADMADAIVTAYHGGQEGSRMIAHVLVGDINPSGKLTQTWPKVSQDTPLTDTEEHYETRLKGKVVNGIWQTHLTEGIFFGYRWYDKYNIEPAFAFGYGLSYTSFQYTNLKITPYNRTFKVSLDVTNTGGREGDEVVQVYLGKANVPSYAQMAEKQLAGYVRVKKLIPGESRHVSILIDEQCLSFWDIALPLTVCEDGTRNKWHRILGERKVYVAASSRDIRLTGKINVTE